MTPEEKFLETYEKASNVLSEANEKTQVFDKKLNKIRATVFQAIRDGKELDDKITQQISSLLYEIFETKSAVRAWYGILNHDLENVKENGNMYNEMYNSFLNNVILYKAFLSEVEVGLENIQEKI